MSEFYGSDVQAKTLSSDVTMHADNYENIG